MSRIFSEYPYVDYENFNLDWILKKMKECIQRYHDNEEAIDALQVELQDLREYVDHYFDSQDFESLIRHVLDEMEDDGTLAKIINTEIFEGLSLGKLDNARMSHAPFVNYGYIINNKRRNLGMNIHSGAICAIGQTQFIIGSQYPGLDETSGSDGIFRRISIQRNEDEIASITRSKVGHANSICVYNDNELLVAPQYFYINGAETDTDRLVVLNLSGVVVREIVAPTWMRTVSRDPVTGIVYCADVDCNLYTIDPDTDKVTLYKEMPSSVWKGGPGGYNQDMAVYNGILYVSSPWNHIKAIRISDLKILFDVSIGEYDSSGFAFLGELDGMEFTEEGNLLALFDTAESASGYYVGFVGEIRIGTAAKLYSDSQARYCFWGQPLSPIPALKGFNFGSSTQSKTYAEINMNRDSLTYSRVLKDVDIIPFIKPRFNEVMIGDSSTIDTLLLPDFVTVLDIGRSGKSQTISVDRIIMQGDVLKIWIADGCTLELGQSIRSLESGTLKITGGGTIRAKSGTVQVLDPIGAGSIVSAANNMTFTNITVGKVGGVSNKPLESGTYIASPPKGMIKLNDLIS